MSRTFNQVSSSAVACALCATALLGSTAGTLNAATLYNNRASFEAVLASFVTDDYEALAYRSGDALDGGEIDIHTNASMNAIFSETRYTTTGFLDWNVIFVSDGSRHYCAGCNGSYELDFTDTSVGTANGVGGVGLEVQVESVRGTHAFVTYGDNSTEDFEIPVEDFWGITSPIQIKKIHFGLENGGTNTDPSVQMIDMDNLTIGALVPEPNGLMLLLGAMTSIPLVARRSKP